MRIALFYAPYPGQRFRDEPDTISPVRTHNPKSALVTLAAGVRRYLDEWGVEHEFRLIDAQVGDGAPELYSSFAYGPRMIDCYRYGGAFEDYDADILEADVIGISSNFTNSARVVTDFAKHMNRVNPDALLVVGGMDASARPDWYLESGFDVVVQLEGEYSFAKVVQARALGARIEDHVPSRVSPHGLIVLASAPLHMSDLPVMALDLVDGIGKYTDTGEGTPPSAVCPPFTCFETSRGCYRRCSFCATPMRGQYRYMSPAAVRRHLEYFRSQGITSLLFQEDNVLSRIQRSGTGRLLHESGRGDVLEIFRTARELGFSWEFANGLEFGKFLDTGAIDLELMEALFWNEIRDGRWRGCYRVQISLEYLGDAPGGRFNKLRSYQEQIEILTAMLGMGVRYPTFNLLIGHDDDDRAKIDLYRDRCIELRDELRSIAPDSTPYFNVFNRTVLPGTPDFAANADRLAFDVAQTPEVISVYLSPMGSGHLGYYELFEERLRLTEAINGSLIDRYDGIYRTRSRDEVTDVVI